MRRSFLILSLFTSVVFAFAQTGMPAAAPDAQQIVRGFGGAFSVLPGFPVLTADLDGDGKQDAVLVATAKDPILDQSDFHYKVVDPYNDAFGFGDPKITSKFNAHVDNPPMLLIVSDWRAVTPPAKFVVINLPFEKLSIGRVLVKKRTVTAIAGEEMSGATNFVYWDGKKWKWKGSDAIE